MTFISFHESTQQRSGQQNVLGLVAERDCQQVTVTHIVHESTKHFKFVTDINWGLKKSLEASFGKLFYLLNVDSLSLSLSLSLSVSLRLTVDRS